MSRVTDWSRKFDEAIPLPKSKTLPTLRDAALYITKLPKAEHDAVEWQAAMEALILVADLGGPMMFARIGRNYSRPDSPPAHGVHPTGGHRGFISSRPPTPTPAKSN